MNCKCGTQLRVIRTLKPTPDAKVSEAACPVCHRTYVTVSAVVQEHDGYGSGAHAVSKRIAEGKLRIRMEDSDAAEPNP